MSYYKNKQIEAEDERIVLFQKQKEILQAYEAEERDRKQREANAYTQALKHCGLT